MLQNMNSRQGGSNYLLQQRWQRGIYRPLQKGFPFCRGLFYFHKTHPHLFLPANFKN